MVEQIQVNPPYDLVATLTSGAADTDLRPSANHAGSTSQTQSKLKDTDTVTLSASAQASQLYLQGNSVTEIAALLGLPAATVDSDLNIKSSTSQLVESIASQAPAAQGGESAAAASSPYTARTTSGSKSS